MGCFQQAHDAMNGLLLGEQPTGLKPKKVHVCCVYLYVIYVLECIRYISTQEGLVPTLINPSCSLQIRSFYTAQQARSWYGGAAWSKDIGLYNEHNPQQLLVEFR